jgi:hypothetical protein
MKPVRGLALILGLLALAGLGVTERATAQTPDIPERVECPFGLTQCDTLVNPNAGPLLAQGQAINVYARGTAADERAYAGHLAGPYAGEAVNGTLHDVQLVEVYLRRLGDHVERNGTAFARDATTRLAQATCRDAIAFWSYARNAREEARDWIDGLLQGEVAPPPRPGDPPRPEIPSPSPVPVPPAPSPSAFVLPRPPEAPPRPGPPPGPPSVEPYVQPIWSLVETAWDVVEHARDEAEIITHGRAP